MHLWIEGMVLLAMIHFFKGNKKINRLLVFTSIISLDLKDSVSITIYCLLYYRRFLFFMIILVEKMCY